MVAPGKEPGPRSTGAARPTAEAAGETTPLLESGKVCCDTVEPPNFLTAPVQWVQMLVKAYSWRLLAMVFCTAHLLKGFVAGGGDSGLLGAPVEFLLQDYGVSGGQMQIYCAVAFSPWALKPLIGLMSDSCPILGYQKMPYILATSATGLMATCVLGLKGTELSLPALVACLFLAFLQVSTVDLLVKARQSTEVKNAASLGPDFFLFTWLGIVLGMIAAALLVGPLIHFFTPRSCYLVALPFMFVALWPTAMNYLGEQPLPPAERAGRAGRNFRAHPEGCCLSLFMGLALIGISVLSLSVDESADRVLAVVGGILSLMLIGAFAIFIRKEIAYPVIFWFVLQVCPKVDGALFYFYTDGPEAMPGGPHFSPWLYATGMSLAAFMGHLLGYLTGSGLFGSWRYQAIVLLTVPLRAILRVALLPVLWRWTVTRFGVSDAAWALTVELLSNLAFAWSWIPRQVMNAHTTPTSFEATMLALMAGSFNMAGMVSSYLGCWLLEFLGCCADGGKGDATVLTQLWKPYLVAVLSPVLVLPLLPLLVPNRLQTEVLITEHPESSTHDSPFSRYLGPPASKGRGGVT
mmetsp:Transcript_84821/g.274748  ORF Transcript_84821/g.274748 Transcript_84821/m.274748 type:complete len:577 (-) Transcript_84821:3-1733(-)